MSNIHRTTLLCLGLAAAGCHFKTPQERWAIEMAKAPEMTSPAGGSLDKTTAAEGKREGELRVDSYEGGTLCFAFHHFVWSKGSETLETMNAWRAEHPDRVDKYVLRVSNSTAMDAKSPSKPSAPVTLVSLESTLGHGINQGGERLSFRNEIVERICFAEADKIVDASSKLLEVATPEQIDLENQYPGEVFAGWFFRLK
ncbi:MAG: hypothetical protein HOW73_09555 [Polyangiaceae bacterium]|nr:hypothetical protein [Polyangiaceae bacterium]